MGVFSPELIDQLNRSVPVRVVDDIDADDVQPGDIEVRGAGHDAGGYAFACPGCGSRSWLAIGPDNPSPRWVVTAGDVARPDTVTLSPSIFHTRERGGCGWHGWLRDGVLVPC